MFRKIIITTFLLIVFLVPTASVSAVKDQARQEAPQAVIGVCRFTRAPYQPGDRRVWRCECGKDNPFMPWSMCLRRQR